MSDLSLNPLINQQHLLDFEHITAECVTPAVRELLSRANRVVAQVTAPETLASWQSVVEPLERACHHLSRAWGAVGHLMSVMDNPQLREAYNENLPVVTAFYIGLSQNEALFAKYKAIASGEDFKSLDPVKRRFIEHEIRDFRLSGADLPADKKAQMKTIGELCAQLNQKFSENLLDATNAFTLDITDKAELAGIPDDILTLYRAEAEAAGIDGWRLTLQYPSYIPAMQYCENRQVRQTLYRAFTTRAAEFGPKELDNTPLIEELLALRAKEAALLDMHSFAELSLATKMAESPAQVIDFLRDLARRSKPWAKHDQAELEAFAREELGIDKLEPWDQAFASERLRVKRYAYSEQEVRRYFTLPQVFKGLFALVENMFDIRISADSASLWHPDVQFWRITTPTGKLIAQFYTDLYARASKRSGAWMDNDLTRGFNEDGSERTPTAYLVCNFTKPVDGKPSMLTHDDVTTLFHEFGHGLHHMLSRVTVSGLSGINGFEWDAVEMPSQFMENWCWQYEVIEKISAHVDSGEPLPKSLFDKMLAAKNYHAGLFSVRQIEFALFDMLIHSENADPKAFMKVLDEVRKEVCVVPVVPWNRFPQSFSHIFAGGYAAGYYSYKWAEVLSADAFSAFEEEGLFNKATGKRWLDEVISRGASRDAIESFRAFRGRDPRIDALLRHTGMIGEPQN